MLKVTKNDALDYVDNNKNSIIMLGFDDDLRIGFTKEYFAKFKGCDLKLPKSSIELVFQNISSNST